MKIIILILTCVICSSKSASFKNVTSGYHVKVGIPKAKELVIYERAATRIIGGSQVPDVTRYPYQAGIIVTLTTGWTSICGGSLISKNRVLTAAHCWWDGESQGRMFTVVLGSLQLFSGGVRQDTIDILVHSQWNTEEITYDIAMARIKDIIFNNNIQAIPLPTLSEANENFIGQTAIATGYGKINDAQTSFPTTTSLYHTTVSVITNNECQTSFKDVKLHNSHLCTSGKGKVGTCDGDSGGPLTVIWKNVRTQIGVVSFGLSTGCEASMPSVYTRVTAFLTWIQANI